MYGKVTVNECSNLTQHIQVVEKQPGFGMCIISGVISLISFILKMGTIYAHIAKFSRRDKINLLFYRDIYQYSGEEYLKLVYSHYSKKECKEIDTYELHLAKEIVYNSMIATMKYYMFKILILIDIFAFVLLIVFLLV